jgi:TRAP-type C4-dicarboxylate transport system substrate-binding protein
MKWNKLLTSGICLLMLVALFSISPALGQEKVMKLNYSTFMPALHKQSMQYAEWSKEVEKRTNGRVKITMFYAGTLTPAPTIYQGVIDGISDIGMVALPYTAGRFPLSEVTDLPWGYKNSLVATVIANKYYKKFRPKEFDQVKVLYLNSTGPGILMTKMPIRSLEDLKGRKIRGSAVNAKVVEALGGTPVNMPVSDAYDAASRGVIDGVWLPAEALEGWKLAEVLHFVTACYSVSTGQGLAGVMNKKKWNALSKNDQKIIDEIDEEYIEKCGKLWDEVDTSALAYFQKLGGKIISLSKEENERWVKAVQPIFADYVKERKAQGLPGEEVLEFYKAQLKRYQ